MKKRRWGWRNARSSHCWPRCTREAIWGVGNIETLVMRWRITRDGKLFWICRHWIYPRPTDVHWWSVYLIYFVSHIYAFISSKIVFAFLNLQSAIHNACLTTGRPVSQDFSIRIISTVMRFTRTRCMWSPDKCCLTENNAAAGTSLTWIKTQIQQVCWGRMRSKVLAVRNCLIRSPLFHEQSQ